MELSGTAGGKTSVFSSSADTFKLDSMYGNPNLIRQAWEAASEEVSKKIISDL